MMQRTATRAAWIFVGLGCLAGCPSETSGGGGDDSSTGGITGVPSTSATSSDPSLTSTASDSGSGSGSGGESSADTTAGDSGSDDSTGIDPTTNDPDNPIDCGGAIYGCGDGVDNDGDGHTDLQDPECTGPCDDDEATFQTGLPGDNMDCKQDCFFDGNSGQGDDGCIWDLRCDPEDPGAQIGCAYTGGNNCANNPPNQDPECVMFCEQYVPPGCDCFGCCTVETPDGPVDVFLNSGPDCALDNLDACETCTSQIDDCGVPCLDTECQICFGQTEPPPGCDDNTCPGDDPCDSDSPEDCPTDFFCYLGCCYPPPPG